MISPYDHEHDEEADTVFQHQTNIELVIEMMEHSQTGALKQIFILEAIRVYANRTLVAPDWTEPSLVHQDAWRQCAQECIDALIAYLV